MLGECLFLVIHVSRVNYIYIKKVDQWNYGYKVKIQRCIQHIIKENLLFLKDVLEPQRIKFTNIWIQYQKADRVNEYNIHIVKQLEDPKFEVGDHLRI